MNGIRTFCSVFIKTDRRHRRKLPYANYSNYKNSTAVCKELNLSHAVVAHADRVV